VKTIILECDKYETMNDFYNDIAQKMNFPEYFGKNYDALKDCLSEVNEDICIALAECDVFAEKAGIVKVSVLKRVLFDVSKENPKIRVAFA
jgi:RNAse (barnase) inhibitor barstar